MILGVDVSNNNGTIDWRRLKQVGVAFVWAKATEGTGFVDRWYDDNRVNAAKHGMVFGAYSFLDTRSDPVEAAKLFMKVAKPKKGDLIPVIDVEWQRHGDPPARQLNAWVRDFLRVTETICGVTPGIYTAPGFWSKTGYTTEFARYPLWIASWRTSRPQLPAGWHDYVAWQVDEFGTRYGLPTNFDVDVTTPDRLKKLIIGPPPAVDHFDVSGTLPNGKIWRRFNVQKPLYWAKRLLKRRASQVNIRRTNA